MNTGARKSWPELGLGKRGKRYRVHHRFLTGEEKCYTPIPVSRLPPMRTFPKSLATFRKIVVIQGFMKARFIPGKHVALDGFYKHPDGTVSTMPNEEFYEFD
jgi:hypothetical protein